VKGNNSSVVVGWDDFDDLPVEEFFFHTYIQHTTLVMIHLHRPHHNGAQSNLEKRESGVRMTKGLNGNDMEMSGMTTMLLLPVKKTFPTTTTTRIISFISSTATAISIAPSFAATPDCV
jgi:hypothetical protein